jgi:hypothetical protein
MTIPKEIGFLSFGAWRPGGGTRDDALRQTVELAAAAQEIAIEGRPSECTTSRTSSPRLSRFIDPSYGSRCPFQEPTTGRGYETGT